MTPAKPAKTALEIKAYQFVLCQIDTDRSCSNLIITNCRDRASCPGIHQVQEKQHCQAQSAIPTVKFSITFGEIFINPGDRLSALNQRLIARFQYKSL